MHSRVPSHDVPTPRFEMTHSSDGRGWSHLQVDCYKLAPQFEPVATPNADAHMIPVVLAGSCVATTRTDGRVLRAQVFRGSMSLMPAGLPAATDWTHEISMGHLYLSPTLLATTTDSLGRGEPELVPQSYFRDPFVEQVCLALVGELESTGPFGALYADTLAQALSLHLLRKYSTSTELRSAFKRGLSRLRLKLVIDHIEDRMATGVSVDELSALAGLSPAYFARQFKDATGWPPHRYLNHRRLERAKELLARGGMTIAEVSQAVGFFDQSHMDRHFKQVLEISPKDVAKERRNVRI